MNPEDHGKIGRIRFKRSWFIKMFGELSEAWLFIHMVDVLEQGIPCEVIP